MRLAQLGAATALVAVSQAFLLPPTITSADKNIIKALPFKDAVSIKDRVLDVDCPGCPVSVADIEGKIHSVQGESILRLQFSLSLINDLDHLLLNGHQIYPIDLRSNIVMQPLEADQLVKSPADTWEYAASPELGYSISIRHPEVSNNERLGLIEIHIEIIEVDDKFVNGIPSVDVKLLETTTGKLMIADAEVATVRSPSSKPTDDSQECTSTICKWRAIIAHKLSKISGCAGKAHPGAHGTGEASAVRPHGHGRPRPHHPHRHHHRHGGLGRFLRNIVLRVLIPIMVGVVVGVTTSLVGMVVGHLIIFIWRVLFRRGQRGQYHRVQQEVDVADDDNKILFKPQGPPPSYEEAPAYEVAVADEKASE
jgi:hypothetical protein